MMKGQQRKALKFDDVLGWKDDLAEKGHLRDEVKTVVLFITTRGEQCCSPLSLAEKARIPELEFVSLAIGNQPPKNWQEAFKFVPETDEERLDRLLGTKTSSTTETVVETAETESESPEIAARKRRRRSSEIVEQENERTKRAGQIYARRNALDYKEDEKVDFFYQMEDLNTTYHHRMSKVTQLICHAKETETRYFSIRACDKAGNCGIPSPLAPVRVTLYYDSSLRNMPELPQKNELTGGDKDKQQQTGGVAFLFGSRKKKNQGKSKGASKAGSRHGSAGRKASTGKDNSDRRSIRSGKSTGNSVSAVKAKQRLASRSGGAGAQVKGRKQSIASNTSSNKSGVRRGPKASTVKLKAKKRNQSTLNK
ncbi:Oidioi.mRNA.OKI2018_I69.PAR.g9946.t1.cds [Oikopleura dioica]|uniref:Oidioi.mRNA.OKI2018_I69.PAR.g9946.t1.cds n=1 Tax=Oikopleura dioica TaxID=34765 RepID=A0ABN7RN30_OIKDI|nr:Oidioi.mRNA.OKI2018_I69.PAR.g9946.t1.cds [Oikopleura dioica]